MKYELFVELYREALEYENLDMFIGERGWQTWMEAYSIETVAEMLKSIYFLAHSPLREIREHYGYKSRTKFSTAYGLKLRTVENWEGGQREISEHDKMLIAYSLFESDYHKQEELKMNEYKKLKEFIEEDLGRELKEFDPTGIYNGHIINVGIVDYPTEKIVLSANEVKVKNMVDRYMVDFLDGEIYVSIAKD